MLSTRSRDSLGPAALAAGIFLAVLLLSRIVHAATGDPVAAAPPLGWPEYLGIGLAALAGLRVVVDVALAGLKWLAPRTKTTLDDTARDDFQLVHDKLDALARLVQDVVPNSKPQQPAPAGTGGGSGQVIGLAVGGIVPPRGSGAAGLLAVLLLGTGLALSPTGCTAAQRTGVETSAKSALVNCTAQAIGTTPGLDLATLVAVANTVAAERVKCTPAGGSFSWSCAETDLIAEGVVLGGCAMVRLVTDAVAAASPAAAALASADRVSPGAAALEHFRDAVAPGVVLSYHTASGDY